MSLEAEGSWLTAQASLLAQPMSAALRAWIESDSPYRPAYVFPGTPRSPWKPPDPWLALREDNPFVWAQAPMAELCLAWLAREFGRS